MQIGAKKCLTIQKIVLQKLMSEKFFDSCLSFFME